jgi:hypothetical protein
MGAIEQPREVIEAIIELEKIRREKAIAVAREKLLRAIIIGANERVLSPPEVAPKERIEGKTIDIGARIERGGPIRVFGKITRRRGSEVVNIPLLRSKLGEEAEEYITQKMGSTVVSNLNPLIAEEVLNAIEAFPVEKKI